MFVQDDIPKSAAMAEKLLRSLSPASIMIRSLRDK